MKLTILKETKDSIAIKFENEDATFASALKDELWNVKGVDSATVVKKHPLVGFPEMVVQGKEPRKLLKSAVQILKKNTEEFEKAILK